MEINRRERRTEPNAKQKVKIAEKMFPMTAETARVPSCLTLSTRFPSEEERKGHGFGTKSIWVSQKMAGIGDKIETHKGKEAKGYGLMSPDLGLRRSYN